MPAVLVCVDPHSRVLARYVGRKCTDRAKLMSAVDAGCADVIEAFRKAPDFACEPTPPEVA